MRERPTLQGRFVWAVTGVSTAAVALFATAVLFSMHRQAHQQTDAMLTQMVRTEADGVIREIRSHGIHVHDTQMTLPTMGAPVVEKYAFAYGPDCRIQAATHNISAESVPAGWCRRELKLGDHEIFETEAVADTQLRAASFVARTPDGTPVTFVTGLRHDLVDRAIWQTGLLTAGLALLVVLAVAGVSAYIARRLTADITALSRACEEVPEDLGDVDEQAMRRQFGVSDRAPVELSTLASTLRTLLGKAKRMVDIQNWFIAEAAHELRTPLTALTGDLSLALRRERDADAYRQALERARGDADRLAELTEELLEVARTRSDAVVNERVWLPKVVRQRADRFDAALKEAGIALDIDDETSKPAAVSADTHSVERVIDNLVENAVSHSGASRLKIALTDGGDLAEEPAVELHVMDDGVGIDEPDLERLFAPFHRRSGSDSHGLGLYLARRLMRSHGGDLQLAEPTDTFDGAHWVATFNAWRDDS